MQVTTIGLDIAKNVFPRDLLMRQRTQLINALRAHLAELGIVAAQGNAGLKELLKIIAGERDARLPVDAHASLVVLAAGLHAVQTMVGSIDKRIMIEHRSNAMEASLTRKQAAYMAAPERFAKRQIHLAPRAPSIHGPLADIAEHLTNVCF